MKKLMMVATCMLVTAGMCLAQGVYIGGHAAYTVGGDIVSESIGYGGQIGFAANENIALELAATTFTDEFTADNDGEMDAMVAAASIILSTETDSGVALYIGGGASMFTADTDASDAQIGQLLAPDLTVPEVEALITAAGETVTMTIDDSIGFHACAGIRIPVSDVLSLFAEYRHTILEVESELTVTQGGVSLSNSSKADYNYGLAKAGLNILF